MRHSDGSHVWVTLAVRPIRDLSGRVVGGRCQMVDVTGHKKVDQLKDEFVAWHPMSSTVPSL